MRIVDVVFVWVVFDWEGVGDLSRVLGGVESSERYGEMKEIV